MQDERVEAGIRPGFGVVWRDESGSESGARDPKLGAVSPDSGVSIGWNPGYFLAFSGPTGFAVTGFLEDVSGRGVQKLGFSFTHSAGG